MAATIDAVSRPYQHFTDFGSGKPTVAGVLHNTVGTTTVTTFQSAGGWHWQVDRDGTIYRDVPMHLGAWHVARTDRWRPSWMLKCPGGQTSDPNYCTAGIEVVSYAGGANPPAGYVDYTDAQYVALRRLLAYLTATWGVIPWVGHGQIQADRSDPVRFDWHRAGFGTFVAGWGYRFLGGPPAPEEEDVGVIDELGQQVRDLKAEVTGLNGVNTELQGQIEALRTEVAARNSDLGALTAHTIPELEARVAQMEEQVREAMALASKATAQRPARVVLEYPPDGSLGYVPEP